MNYKISFFLCNFYLFNMMLIHSMEKSPTKDYRRIIMIIDNDQKVSSSAEALMQTFTMAFIEETAPILINHLLFQELVQFKNRLLTEILRHPEAKKYIEQFNTLLIKQNEYSDIHNEVTKLPLASIRDEYFIYHQIAPTGDKWQLFDIPNTPYLLLIPKRYISWIIQKPFIGASDNYDNYFGFNITKMSPLELPTDLADKDLISKLNQIASQLTTKPTKFSIDNLHQLFTVTPYTKDKGYNYSWNIWQIGHGLIPEQQIAGMPLAKFSDQLSFLNTVINTNFFYYVTCFGGHFEHLTQPFKSFKGLKELSFPVASGSTTDLAVTATWLHIFRMKPYRRINGYVVPALSIHFNDFFNSLESQQPFEKALPFVSAPMAKNIPLIRFPGTDWFAWTDLNKKVVAITKTNLAAHLIDQKDYHIAPPKEAVLIYPEIIPTKIYLKNNTPGPLEIILMANFNSRYLKKIEVENLVNLLTNLTDTAYEFPKFIYSQNLIFPARMPVKKFGKTTNELIKIMIDNNDVTHNFLQNQKIILSNVILLIEAKKTGLIEGKIGIKFILNYNNTYYHGYYDAREIKLTPLDDHDLIATVQTTFKTFETKSKELEEHVDKIRKSSFLKSKNQ